VLRIRLPHHPRDYAVLALLHVSLLLRLVAGDGLGIDAARIAGGILGALALLAFVANSAVTAVAASRHRPTQPDRFAAGRPTPARSTPAPAEGTHR
jgi:hypothetical protein